MPPFDPPSAAIRSGARHAAFHEVGGNSGEIIMRQPFSGVTAGIVPARTELAAAADIGLHRGAAALQPELAECGVVMRLHRKAEAAIGAHIDRCIAGLGGGTGLHIGNALAVDRNRLMAGDDESVGGKGLRRLLQDGGAGDAFDQQQRWRRHRILHVGEQVAIALGFVTVETPDIDHADFGKALQSRARPAACRRRADFEHRAQLVENRQDELAGGPEKAL